MRFVKGLPVEFGMNEYGLMPSCILHEHADADARHVFCVRAKTFSRMLLVRFYWIFRDII